MLHRNNLNLTSNVLSILLLMAGVIAAILLVWLGQAGGLSTVVYVSVVTLVTVAALASNEFGLLALIFVAATDGFLKGVSPGWHTQLLKDYIIAICLLRWAWLSVMGHRRESARLPMALPIILFAGWVVVQLINPQSPSILVSLAGVRMWTIWLPVFFLAYDVYDERRKIERMLIFVIALMVPLAIYGIVQYQIGLDHLMELSSGFRFHDKDYYWTGEYELQWRPPSTMVAPHNFAAAATMVALMSVGALLYFARNRFLQAMVLIALPLLAIGVLVSAVRTAALSAVVGLFALLVVVRRFDLATLAAIVGILAIFQVDALTGGEALDRISSVVESPQRIRGRVYGPLRYAVISALERPLGHGVATGAALGRMIAMDLQPLEGREAQYLVENEYGRTLRELGFPGFIFFMWMLFVVMRNNYRAYRDAVERRDKWLAAGLFAACVSLLARLAVGAALYTWPEAPLFWIYTAMAARLPKIEEQERARRETPSSEARVTVLGATELPWRREDEDR
jgi:hypothetical protein